MATNIRDCVECADPCDTKDMYPKEGYFICEPCFLKTFSLDEGDR